MPIKFMSIHLQPLTETVTPPPVEPTSGATPPGEKVEVMLRNIHSPKKFGLIPLTLRESPQVRDFFPGYKIDLILETDGEITTRVTSATC